MATKKKIKVLSKKEKVEKLLIEISLKIAKEGKGCIFAIEEQPIPYEHLIEQDIKPFDIFQYPRRLEALAVLDGACIITLDGQLKAYATRIAKAKTFSGYGTRHSAAYTASLNKNTAIMASEEDRKVKIFKNGVLVMQMDPFEKNIEYQTKEAVNILESIGIGSVASVTATALAPASYAAAFGISAATPAGLVLVPGIILFGTSHYLIRELLKHKKK